MGSRGYFQIEYELLDTEISDAALGLLVRLRHDCALRESDGVINRYLVAGAPKELVAELIRHDLLTDTAEGYRDVGFLTCNRSRQQRAAERAAWSRRQRKHRASAVPITRDTPRDVTGESHRSESESESESESGAEAEDKEQHLETSSPLSPETGDGEDFELHVVPSVVVSDEELILRHWEKSTGRKARLTPPRRKMLRRARSLYPLEECLDAAEGWQWSAHHRGENDRHQMYNDLELIFRDPASIERFRDYKRTQAPALTQKGRDAMGYSAQLKAWADDLKAAGR